MTESATQPIAWQLAWQALADNLAAVGIAAAPNSPIARFLPPPSSKVGEAPAQELVPLLGLLAQPRQALVLHVGEHATGISAFVSDGAHVARFDRGKDGCIVSEPSGPDGFIALVTALAPRQPWAGPELVVTRASFESLRQLSALGLFGANRPMIPLVRASEAISEVARGRDPCEILGALERDGILVLDGEEIQALPEWARNHAPAVAPAVISIRAAECGDGHLDRPRDKRLLVLGADTGAVAFLPPQPDEPHFDTIVDIVPATPAGITAAVRKLLAPPLAPPSRPAADRAVAPSLWLQAQPGDHSELDADWHEDTLEDAAARSHLEQPDAPPVALLAPAATIEVLAREGGAPVQRHVFAFDDHSALEWTLRGSRLLWREHDAHSLAQRVDGLAQAPEATHDSWCVMRAVARVEGHARVFEFVSDAARGSTSDCDELPMATSSRDVRLNICAAWGAPAGAGR